MTVNRTHTPQVRLGKFALVVAAFVCFGKSFAFSNGIDGYSGAPGGGPDCTAVGCHVVETPPVAVPSVTIDGPATATAGVTNSYTVSISGGPGMTAGLDVAGTDGMLAAPAGSTDVQLMNQDIVHVAPMTMAGTPAAASFAFEWTAPAVNGTYTLYAAGLSSDGGATSGVGADGTALATLAITVTGAANQPPVANISAPATAAEGVPVTFDGSGSSDADGTIALYEWDFGDGTTGAGVTTTHAFVAGTFNVQLTVTDDAGATGVIGASIEIIAAGQPVPPSANAGGPYTAEAGTAVMFDGSASSDADGTIATYSWDFGDGNTGTGMQASNTYGTPGSYVVRLTVTDDAGLTGQAMTTATISPVATNPPPPPGGGGGTGEALYTQFCGSCHGANGVGGSAGDVVGESAEDILEAGEEYPTEMGFILGMPAEDVASIAAFLNVDEADDVDDLATGSAGRPGSGSAASDSSSGTASSSSGKKASTGGGVFDALMVLLAGLAWFSRNATWRRQARYPVPPSRA